MKVCIDTNAVLQARSSRHRFGVILDGFADGKFVWAISPRILWEYEEIISRHASIRHWSNLLLFMQMVNRRHHNLQFEDPWYEFRIISADPDDNAFTDCAICAHADYIITEDRDFAPLANAGYKPQPITPDEFIARYRGVYV
mgnify:CR=1 FL=1|jgi:putative PIN family toxin of toxin-antitoxin system